MDFQIDSELSAKLAQIRAFVIERVQPLEPLLLAGEWDALDAGIAACRAEVRARGWWAPNLPAAEGGTGQGLVTLGLVSEVLGRSPLGHFVFGCQAPDAGNAELLASHGTPAQRAQFLEPLATGEIRSCFLMTEPEFAGSNPTEMGTTAERDGDEFVINGHKWFATAADGARFGICMAVTDPGADKYRRASMILVETDRPGYRLVRNIPVMGHPGRGFFSHGEVRLENVRVPVENLLGEAGAGFAMAQERLGPGRIHHCMRWLGICRRALDEMIAHVLKREIKPGLPLAKMGAIQDWIAESAAEVEAARALVLMTAWTIEQEGFRAARERVSMIKYYTANVMQRVVDRALQAHGGLGVTDDRILAFFFREERAARIYDGPDEVHRMAVSRRLLKSAAER
ncbi:MAG TPA: acyl-CoA dehydrogenase family protein [Gammaproteobacteria bacterium]|nr:acyl-CoA dehydrogenase family protein [Gammaproteobacteria bacterium]